MGTTVRDLAVTLTEIARDIATLGSPDLLLASIVRRVRQQVGTDIAYISLNDADLGETYIRTTDGVRTDAYAAIRMPLGTGVLGLAAGGVIAETPDYLPDEGKTHLPDIDRVVQVEGVRAILGAPLRVSGKVLGALMTANRRPGTFTVDQRESLERLASLAAAAVELVAAKHSEREAHELAQRAATERDQLVQAENAREQLDLLLSSELVEQRGLEDLLQAATTIISGGVEVRDGHGYILAAATPTTDDPHTPQASASAPLIGPARPGTVVIHVQASQLEAQKLADLLARYASIALVHDRSLDDVRHFHENELVGALLASNDPERPASSSAMIHRALGSTGAMCIAVLLPAQADEPGRRRLVRHVRSLARRSHTIVAAHLGRIVVVSRDTEDELRERLTPLIADASCFGGVAVAATLALAPAAYDQAAGIAASMRALGRPGSLAGTAEAGIAGLMLRTGDPETAKRFVAAHLSPLNDSPRGDALLQTALAYLDAHGAINEAARTLHLHPNTIRQRLERIDSELGPSWREGAHRLDVHVALRLWQLSRDIPTNTT
ncbi:Purine catabolism regulatory protein [Microbacterium azadirachtae]|uniref:Purine catabolism regulatory protein n=1 Tax=Microbacterium azadirachtae TaxID=582680 RepID=A0A0F0KW32_9MICO|nr:GAF domain-containing protein [Microbacterium azadirachtae]KJL24300.1 Purine catabolism regulatory protein [Microbacterium azadirachtae]